VCLQITADPHGFDIKEWTTDGGPHELHSWRDLLRGRRIEAVCRYAREWEAWRDGKIDDLPPSTKRPELKFTRATPYGTRDLDWEYYYGRGGEEP
jgi:hypothetical protein